MLNISIQLFSPRAGLFEFVPTRSFLLLGLEPTNGIEINCVRERVVSLTIVYTLKPQPHTTPVAAGFHTEMGGNRMIAG